MDNLTKRLLAMILAVMCICMCCTGVNAEENDSKAIPGLDPSEPAIGPEDGGTMTFLFSIVANEVHDILGSRSATDKYFTTATLPSDAEYLVCVADLDHSLIDMEGMFGRLDQCVQYGICCWDYSYLYGEYRYDSVYIDCYASGALGTVQTSEFVIDDRLEDGVQYYSYVKNAYGDPDSGYNGYVFGTLYLYYK